MSKISVVVGLVVLGAGASAFYVQNRATNALRREISGLREDVRLALATAKTDAARATRVATAEPGRNAAVVSALPTVPSEDIARLRDEIAALRKSTTTLTQFAEAATAAQALKQNSESIATKLVPTNQWKNAGKATPEATTETVLWAALGGDVDTLAGTLTFTDTARAKADQWFATLSENTRQQYGSAEKILALMIARDAASLTGMQVLGQKEVAADNVGVRVRFAAGEKVKDETFLMRRNADGWRMVLPDSAVEKFAKQLGGGK